MDIQEKIRRSYQSSGVPAVYPTAVQGELFVPCRDGITLRTFW